MSNTKEYCKQINEYNREKYGIVTLGYQMSEDKFVPKEVIEHNGCMGCVYEDFEDLEYAKTGEINKEDEDD